MINWKVIYEIDNSNVEKYCINKMSTVRIYLYLLKEKDVSSLKILKNDKDYIETLNKFLSK